MGSLSALGMRSIDALAPVVVAECATGVAEASVATGGRRTATVADGTTTEGDRTVVVADHLLVGLLAAVPVGQASEETNRYLGLLVRGHLVEELAALLSEGAGAVVDPLVAVDFLTAGQARNQGTVAAAAAQDDGARAAVVGTSGDDGVDAVLL